MDLREAVERPTSQIYADLGDNRALQHIICEKAAYEALSAAAKRELERQEASKPKRYPLLEMERRCRELGILSTQGGCAVKDRALVEAADILKALREKVVPWLKIGLHGTHGFHRANESREMLEALGEDGT